MEVLYLLIPVSLLLLAGIVWILLWAVRDGQFDDLDGPAHRILLDEDRVVGEKKAGGEEPAETLLSKSRSQREA